MTRCPQLSQAPATRAHLCRASHHLARSRAFLRRAEPDYLAAAGHVEACYREALAALAAWHCVRGIEGADLRELGDHAMNFANVLRTPVRRALAVQPTLRAVGGRDRLGVHDREGVETAWYTARNLYLTAWGEVPAGVRPARPLLAVPAGPTPAERRGSDRPVQAPTASDRSVPAPMAL